MSEKFDPSRHLRQLRGKGGAAAEYLDVKYRLVWLRTEHPDATSAVEHVEISPDIAIFKATVSIPNRGSATDYGSETPRDFSDYIEKAATKALGRALAQLGFGTQFVGFELDENTRIVDSPIEPPATPAPNRRAPNPPSTPQRAAVAPTAAATPPAASEADLLSTILDDEADPKARKRALHAYYGAATTLDALARRAERVAKSGLPEADLTKAQHYHRARLEEEDKQPATEQQVRFIQALARELGMNELDLLDWSQELYEQDVEQLNRRDASNFIESLQRRRNDVA